MRKILWLDLERTRQLLLGCIIIAYGTNVIGSHETRTFSVSLYEYSVHKHCCARLKRGYPLALALSFSLFLSLSTCIRGAHMNDSKAAKCAAHERHFSLPCGRAPSLSIVINRRKALYLRPFQFNHTQKTHRTAVSPSYFMLLCYWTDGLNAGGRCTGTYLPGLYPAHLVLEKRWMIADAVVP